MNEMNDNKGVRGPAKQSNKWNTKEKHIVYLTEDGEIDGPDEDSLYTNLGILARNGYRVPLTYPSWSEVPINILDDLWREVQVNTDLPNEARELILRSIGIKWKNWKYRVKQMYLANKDDIERLVQVPDERIEPQQWRTLISYWRKEEIQEIARRNKDNRSKSYFPHRTGRTSFKNIKRKMEAQGMDTSLLNLFCVTREPTKDEDTRNLIAQLKNSLSQVPEEEQTETFKNNVWVEHRGLDTRGHVRSVGKYTFMTQRHVPLGDRKAVIQEIKNQIVEEVREEVLQQVRGMAPHESREKIRAEIRAEYNAQFEYMQKTISFLMTHLDVNALPMLPDWIFGAFPGRQGPAESTNQGGLSM